tara:strand:- start:298 stop:543 length:246 start_codon:yes stop_codon:yes gene_type:complete
MKVFSVRAGDDWINLTAKSDVEAIQEVVRRWGLFEVSSILCATFHHKINKDYHLSVRTGERIDELTWDAIKALEEQESYND